MESPEPKPAALIKPTSGHRPFIAVSTKMYFTHARTTSFTSSILSLLTSSPATSTLASAIDAFIIPDFVSLLPTISAIRSSPSPVSNLLSVGAQDCATEDFGAFTGEVSPAVLKEIGCRIVEVGHAERRRLFGETDGVVRDKVGAVVRNGMVPLVCVGEVEQPQQHQQHGVEGAAKEVVRQVEAALEGVDGGSEVVLAYEPVWAIGAPEPAGAEYVKGVVRRVRESEVVKGRRGRTRIVYGGAAGLGLWERLGGEVDGLFLGRFAHDPEQFVKMVYEISGVGAEG